MKGSGQPQDPESLPGDFQAFRRKIHSGVKGPGLGERGGGSTNPTPHLQNLPVPPPFEFRKAGNVGLHEIFPAGYFLKITPGPDRCRGMTEIAGPTVPKPLHGQKFARTYPSYVYLFSAAGERGLLGGVGVASLLLPFDHNPDEHVAQRPKAGL